MHHSLLIAGQNEALMADFTTFASRQVARRLEVIALPRSVGRSTKFEREKESNSEVSTAFGAGAGSIAAAVIFLGRGRDRFEQALLDDAAAVVLKRGIDCVCIVSTFRVNLGDRRAAQSEADARARFRNHRCRLVVFRPGHVLSPNSRATRWLKALWFLWPLFPTRFASCFVTGDELFAAIEQEIEGGRHKSRTFAIPGTNRSWRSMLQSQENNAAIPRSLAVVATILSWLMIGQIAGIVFTAWIALFRSLRPFAVGTLWPSSIDELLTLYNKYSYRDLKIVGYNNGVVHFGHKYPGKTIVSTVHCNKMKRVNGQVAWFDCGVTIRQANELLLPESKEFYVLPNYSYVALATAFFIPIHGSASDFSTMGETIDRVLLYDPADDRFIRARRDDPVFRERYCNLKRDTLLLRLVIRVKPKSQYFMKHLRMEDPTSEQVLSAFQDKLASNVEIRKSKAESRTVDVRKFYTEPPGLDTAALVFPRDKLGQLWDRLEANPLASVLFHAAVRLLGFHVELFFTEAEFRTFWKTHPAFPISKIQLRFIKRDGFPHSPFVEHDCISADMFMWRRHKAAFERYLQENFHAVQFNPGKHSA
jgi:hypothetical protein